MILRVFQAFTPEQYEAMETPQVQAISSSKREYLTVEQNDAIQTTIDRDPDESDPWGPDDEGKCSGTEFCHSCSVWIYRRLPFFLDGKPITFFQTMSSLRFFRIVNDGGKERDEKKT